MSEAERKVIGLRGQTVLAVGEPDQEAIQECEALLERIRSGEVQGFVYAQLWRDGCAGWGAGGLAAKYSVVGALYAALNATSGAAGES